MRPGRRATVLLLGTLLVAATLVFPGTVATAEDLGSPRYWVRHVRETVRFLDGVRWLAGQGVTRFVELGPDPVLCGLIRECLDDEPAVLVPALRDAVPGLDAAPCRR